MKERIFLFLAGLLLSTTLPGVQNARAQVPSVGQPAPGFTLPSSTGGEISLASLHGKYVVLVFYPRDMGNASAAEMKSFQNDLAQYKKYGEVLGICVDPLPSHKSFAAKTGVTFPLLSDESGSVAAKYGSLGSLKGKPAARRATFLIDPEGKIARVWGSVTSPATHSTDVVNTLSVKPPIVH